MKAPCKLHAKALSLQCKTKEAEENLDSKHILADRRHLREGENLGKFDLPWTVPLKLYYRATTFQWHLGCNLNEFSLTHHFFLVLFGSLPGDVNLQATWGDVTAAEGAHVSYITALQSFTDITFFQLNTWCPGQDKESERVCMLVVVQVRTREEDHLCERHRCLFKCLNCL